MKMRKWTWEWKRECSLFLAQSIMTSIVKCPSELMCTPHKNVLMVGKNGGVELYYNTLDLKNTAEKLLKRCSTDRDFIRKYSETTNRINKK